MNYTFAQIIILLLDIGPVVCHNYLSGNWKNNHNLTNHFCFASGNAFVMVLQFIYTVMNHVKFVEFMLHNSKMRGV